MKNQTELESNTETEKSLLFYTLPINALDNFSAHTVELWGKKFQTAEHAYQWKKFVDSYPEIAEEIYHATSPHAVKKISDTHREKVAPIFHENKLEIMEEILRAKAAQHEIVRSVLIDSDDKTLIENSPFDSFWGIGSNGSGENNVGKIWMKIRNNN